MIKYKMSIKKINIITTILVLLIFILSILTIYFFQTYKYTLSKSNNINSNHVPYISTYYIKPIILPKEDVIINFYVTDYNHKEYAYEDSSQTFTITIKIEGKKNIVKKNVKAGDNSVNIGNFNDLGEQKFSIVATDEYKRNSHELFNFFLVRDKEVINEYTMTNDDLNKYNIKNNDT
ncbi:MAG: hypothetical protein ACRC5M_03920, partial [Anaeroplasmataceae bacterium]